MIAFNTKLILSLRIENLPLFKNSFKNSSFLLLISLSLKVEIELSPVSFLSSTKSFSFEKNWMYSWLTALMARVIYFLSFWITDMDLVLKFYMLGRTASS